MIDDFQRPAPKPRASMERARSFNPDEPARVELPEPVLQTPEEVAAAPHPAPTPTVAAGGEHTLPEHAASKPVKTIRLFRKWTISRKKFIIILSALIVLLLAGGAAAYAATRPGPAAVKKPVVKAKAVPPAPAPIISPLTGITIDNKEKTTWPVIGVMIENSPDARPQSGLKDAGIVFEAIAEAGITRFLALYQDSRPGNIGPIRSSRPYYLDWAMAFDASYAHVGGSPDALARIKSIGTKDMDQFFNPSAYHRITSRFAPHNVYTGVQQLADLSVSKGWATSEFTSLPRKADKLYVAPAPEPAAGTTKPKTKAATETRAPANSIDFGISGAFYNAHYDFDAGTNTYKRSEGGAAHTDADSGAQLTPKTVIALVMPYSLMADGYHSQYNTIGSGKMYVFQDGTITTGTWSKGEPKTQFEFKDGTGAPLKLNAGQTWISIVSEEGKVTYK